MYWDSLVGMATTYELGGPRFKSRQDQEIF